MERAAILAITGLLFGCAAPKEYGWVRTDGKPVDPQQYEVATTVCRGEAQKAGLAAPPPQGIAGAYSKGRAQADVFVGCMAQQGYLQREIN